MAGDVADISSAWATLKLFFSARLTDIAFSWLEGEYNPGLRLIILFFSASLTDIGSFN